MNLLIGLLIPFIGTTIGSAMVFLMKNSINKTLEKLFLKFASGVMLAASIWSLLLPSIEIANEQNIISWIPASVGFLLGIFFLLFLDFIIPNLNKGHESHNKLSKSKKFVLAITLHNIPEGMAVGVSFAGALTKNSSITLAAAFALSLGIAIQNLPEGAIISMPLKKEYSKTKSFIIGTFSGIVEPLFAIITILLINLVVPILPYLLSFASGTMIYVIVEELIPEAKKQSQNNLSIIGLSFGFILTMILDITFG